VTHGPVMERRRTPSHAGTDRAAQQGGGDLHEASSNIGSWQSSQRTALSGSVQLLKPRALGLTFVADVENHSVQVLRADGSHIRRLGMLGKDPGNYNSLQGIACNHEAGLLFVSDTCNHRVQVLSFHRSDASDIKLLKVIGERFGSAPGEMAYPTGLAIDLEQQTLVVADTGNDRIQIFTQDGELLLVVGAAGRHPTNQAGMPLFHNPCDVVISQGLIWVLDEGNNRIQVITDTGEHVREIGSVGTKLGQFLRPRQMMACPGGIILVADQDEARVQLLIPEYDLHGKPQFRWTRVR